MINQPKTKEYYLNLQKEKSNEAQKQRKEIKFSEDKINGLKNRMSKLEWELSSRESSALRNESDSNDLKSKAAALELQAKNLVATGMAANIILAQNLRKQAIGLNARSSIASGLASTDRMIAGNIKIQINSVKADISFEEKMKSDYTFKARKAEEEASIFEKKAREYR